MRSLYEPYRFDRNRNGGGILIYVRVDIPSKAPTNHTLEHDIEGIFVELSLRKNKWLLFGSYHPSIRPDDYFFNHVKYSLDIYSRCYDKYMLIGDFNAEKSTVSLAISFQNERKNIIKEPACFNNLSNPSCIDLVITK